MIIYMDTYGAAGTNLKSALTVKAYPLWKHNI